MWLVASRKAASAARVTRRADGVGQRVFDCGNTAASAEHPSSRSVWSILLPLEPRRQWTADSFSLPSPCHLLLARMLSWCPALGTKKRHQGVDTTVDPHYSRYMSNETDDRLDELEAAWDRAKDEMHRLGTPAARFAYYAAADAYNNALDRAEQDPSRW